MNTEIKWAIWLNKRTTTLYYPYNTYTVVEWVENLFIDGILPKFANIGYVFGGNTQSTIGDFLNFLFRFDMNFSKSKPTVYRSSFVRRNRWTVDDEEFFYEKKCTSHFWNSLKARFSIQHWADDSDFSIRLWEEIPHVIFSMIDFKQSRASDELAEWLRPLDDDDENDDERKKDIDPYLIDYGGSKYRDL
jgi:hypothetical protein